MYGGFVHSCSRAILSQLFTDLWNMQNGVKEKWSVSKMKQWLQHPASPTDMAPESSHQHQSQPTVTPPASRAAHPENLSCLCNKHAHTHTHMYKSSFSQKDRIITVRGTMGIEEEWEGKKREAHSPVSTKMIVTQYVNRKCVIVLKYTWWTR